MQISRQRVAAVATAVMVVGLGGAAASSSASAAVLGSSGGSYVPVQPARIVDTRSRLGARTPSGHGTVRIAIDGHGGVPASGVEAVAVTLTAESSGAGGNLTAYADGTARPGTSTLDFSKAVATAGAAVIAVGRDGDIDIHNGGSAATTIRVDVSGYYLAGTGTQAGGYAPVTPTRLVDTRIGKGARPLTAHGTLRLTAAGAHSVPAGASTVVMTVAAATPANSGHLVAFADGTARPSVNELAFTKGVTRTNLLMAPVAANGKVDLYNDSSGALNLVVDIVGYVRTGSTPAVGGYVPITPLTLIGPPGAAVAGGTVTDVSLRSAAPLVHNGVVDAGISAVVVNLTEESSDFSGAARLYSGPAPSTSNLDFTAGRSVGDTVIVPVSASSQFKLFSSAPDETRFSIDLLGYITGGRLTWTTSAGVDPQHGEGVTAISCPTPHFCAAVDGSGSALEFKGPADRFATIARPQVVSATRLSAVSCPTDQFCAAVDDGGYATNWNGTAWSAPLAVDPGAALSLVSCGSPTSCMAATTTGVLLAFDGVGWSTSLTTGARVTGLSCPTSSFCVAGDGSGRVRIFNGMTWAPAVNIAGSTAIQAVSCASAAACTATTNRAAIQYNGTSWASPVAVPLGSSTLLTLLSCGSPTFCVAGVIGDSVRESEVWTGTTWEESPFAFGLEQPTGLSCSDADDCIVSNYDGVYGGRVGGLDGGTYNDRTNSMTTLSCVSSTWCMALDNTGVVVVDHAGAWKVIPGPTNLGVTTLSCGSPTFCVGVGYNSYSVFNGVSWSAAALGPTSTVALSCEATGCMALGTTTAAWFNGTSWRTLPSPALEEAYQSVSCVSATFCLAMDSASQSERWTGSKWIVVTPPSSNQSAGRVSCVSITFCSAVINRAVQLFTGTGWHPLANAALSGVSTAQCTSSTFCVGSSFDGVSVYSGRQWALTLPVDAIVDCPAAGRCIAVSGTSGFVGK
ncbi:hypothetical protein [Jatrophihabitans sp.]|uniref:hypothetical protein n=1 Tax=Jatrophihabitans sp. TaxID=1932789 RepID=UPI0030C6DE36|nr:Peptidase propeptide [Jatrophihabitans sp.]